jgi:hypothetical protein
MTVHPDDDRTPPDDPLDAWIVEQARAHYHAPPAADREALWGAIRQARAEVMPAPTPAGALGRTIAPPAEGRGWWRMRWPVAEAALLAATLLLGVGLARVLDRGPRAAAAPEAPASPAPSPALLAAVLAEHLGRSEMLLTTVRQDAARGTPATDAELAAWARDLLGTTRLLRDARRDDPRATALLDDLELVLAQLVQFQRSGRARDAVALRETLADSDLLTRLRGATQPTMAPLEAPMRTDE